MRAGVDEHGEPFVWIARRARKRVLQPHECSRPPPPVSWLAGLRWKSNVGKPGWWVAALFALGSLMFVVTGIARMFRAVSYPDSWPPGLGSLTAGLGPWPEVVACYLLFFPATILQVLEASNMDLGHRWEKGRWPHFLPTRAELHTVSWWAAVLQVVGIMGFMAGTTGELVGTGHQLTEAAERWTVGFGFFFGGVLFTVASLLACMEETGSWWRGVVPARRSDLRSISWIAVFSAFHGSVGFCVLGGVFFWATVSFSQLQGILVYGHILASLLFALSGLAGLLEQGNPGHQ